LGYKACFHCELLFEVDTDAASSSPCPSCDALLEPYEPSDEELAGADFDEPAHTAALEIDSNIVATMAVEGLAAQVRARMEAEASAQAAPADRATSPALHTTEQPARPGVARITEEPTDPDPPRPRYGQPARRETRVAPLGGDEPTAEPAIAKPAPVAAPRPAPVAAPMAAPVAVSPVATPAPLRSGPSPAVLAGAALVLLLVGAGGWLLLRSDGGDEGATATADAAPPSDAWPDALKAQLEAVQALVPVVAGAEPLAKGPYVAGGPDGLVSSSGTILGMASTTVPDTAVQSDEWGAWATALLAALKRNGADAGDPFLLAIDGQVPVRNLQRMAYAASRAGHPSLRLVVGREAAPGALGALPFTLHSSKRADAVQIRVGVLGFRVDPPGQPTIRVPRTDSGALDITAVGRALDGLAGPTKAVVYPFDEMSVSQLAALLSAVRGRLPDISLSVK